MVMSWVLAYGVTFALVEPIQVLPTLTLTLTLKLTLTLTLTLTLALTLTLTLALTLTPTLTLVEPLQVILLVCAPCLFDENTKCGRCMGRCRFVYNELCAP